LAGKRSARQDFCLGSCKLFVGEHARSVQLGEFIEPGGQIILGRGLWRCGRVLRGRRRSLLLCLCVGGTLLVCLVLLLLRGSILLGVLLVLVMTYGAGCTGDHCRAVPTATRATLLPTILLLIMLTSYGSISKKGFDYAGCSALEIFAIASSTAS
jgi:hypothetical protein